MFNIVDAVITGVILPASKFAIAFSASPKVSRSFGQPKVEGQ